MQPYREQKEVGARDRSSRMPPSVSCIPAALVLVGALAGSGCQTVESTSLVGAVEETGGAKEETGEWQLFMEVVRPEPEWVQREARLRETWLTTDYDADRRRTFRAFEIPDTYTLSMEEFKQDPDQADRTGPHLVLQLRERQFATVKKQHRVQTRSMLSGSKTVQKDIPIFSQWKWEPDQRTQGGVTAWVRAEDLEDEPGLWRSLEGAFDEQGLLVVSLVPWIDAGLLRSRKGPLVLRLTSQAALPPVFIRITPDALFYLQQLHATPEAGKATTSENVRP